MSSKELFDEGWRVDWCSCGSPSYVNDIHGWWIYKGEEGEKVSEEVWLEIASLEEKELEHD